MPIGDRKICYALGNYVRDQLLDIRTAVTRMKAARTAYNTASPDPTGTPLADGGAAAVSGLIDDLDNLANGAVADGIVAQARRSTSALGEL